VTPADFQSNWPDLTIDALSGESLGEVYDQGLRPTCVSLAFTHAHECARSDKVPLSSEYLFWAARQRDGLPESATHTTVSATQIALKDVGQPISVEWPYDPTRVVGPGYSPPTCTTLYTRGSSKTLLTLETLCKVIEQGKTPIIVVGIVEPDFHLAPNGVIHTPSASSTISSWRHAVTVVGWGRSTSHGTMLIIRNSWGPDWGFRGYGLISEAYLTTHLHQTVVLD
jgi:hypothetical protein